MCQYGNGWPVPRSRSSRSSGSPSSAAGSAAPAKKEATPLKVAVITDIGGLNDKGFNALAYNGLKVAQRQYGVKGRVFISKSAADYVPNLSTARQQGYDLVIAVGFLMGDSIAAGREEVPEDEVRDHRRQRAPASRASRRTSAASCSPSRRRAASPASQRRRTSKSGTISSVGGLKIPPVDAYIAGLPVLRQEGEAGHQDAQRLLAGLRRAGQVQGDRPRTRSVRARTSSSRLPAAAASAPSPAAKDSKAWGIGVDNDQCVPRPARADERDEEGRCGRHADDQARRRRASTRAASTVSST